MKKILFALAVIPFTLLACNDNKEDPAPPIIDEWNEDNYVTYEITEGDVLTYKETKTYNDDGIEIKNVFESYDQPELLYEQGERNFDIDELTATTESNYLDTDGNPIGHHIIIEGYNQEMLIQFKKENISIERNIYESESTYTYDNNLLISYHETRNYYENTTYEETLTINYQYDDVGRLVVSDSEIELNHESKSRTMTQNQYNDGFRNPYLVMYDCDSEGKFVHEETINTIDDNGNIVFSSTTHDEIGIKPYISETFEGTYSLARPTKEVTKTYNEDGTVNNTTTVTYIRDEHNRKTQVTSTSDCDHPVKVEKYTY